MGSWKRYLLIGVTAYLLFLIIKVPATLLLPHVNQMLPNSAVSLDGPQGTIWQGSVDITLKPSRGMPLSSRIRLAWSFRVLDLLVGELGVNYKLTGSGLDVEGRASAGLGPTHLIFESGTVAPNWINPFMREQGVGIEQPVLIKDLFIGFDVPKKRTEAAGGVLNWAGGRVSVKKPQPGTLTFPPLQGLVSATEQETLMLEVVDLAGKKPLVTVELLQSGLARIRILKRVQPLIGMGQSGQPDATLLDLKQKVL